MSWIVGVNSGYQEDVKLSVYCHVCEEESTMKLDKIANFEGSYFPEGGLEGVRIETYCPECGSCINVSLGLFQEAFVSVEELTDDYGEYRRHTNAKS